MSKTIKEVNKKTQEIIELFYNDLEITIWNKLSDEILYPVDVAHPAEYESEDIKIEYLYYVSKDKVIDFLVDILKDSESFERYSTKEIEEYVELNFDDLFENYYDEILKEFESDAKEEAEHKFYIEDNLDEKLSEGYEDEKSWIVYKLHNGSTEVLCSDGTKETTRLMSINDKAILDVINSDAKTKPVIMDGHEAEAKRKELQHKESEKSYEDRGIWLCYYLGTVMPAGFTIKESNESIEEDIEKHDELNPALFENNELKSEVKEALQKIVDTFVEELKEDGINLSVKDSIIVGSNVNYNYTKDSDIDLHIIVDSNSLDCSKELQDKLYSAYRSIFNKNYDITVKNIPVEIYVELDEIGSAKSNGIYSLNTGWVKKPVQQDVPELDKDAFDAKFSEWKDKYYALLDEIGVDPATSLDY